jgi:DNA-binding NarL/FixJ family response regulator
MNLILCCGNSSLQDRWLSALASTYTVYQAATLQDLSILVQKKIAFELLFVHRSLVDLETVAYIRSRQPACKLFILSDRPDDSEGLDFIRLGVVGYANSYISSERLQEAARTVATGSVWINQQLMQRLIAESAPAKQGSEGMSRAEERRQLLGDLSDREYQIAGLVAQGLSNLEIADQLGITDRTVKAHLGAIYAKTSTRGRLDLALRINQSPLPEKNQ